MPTSSPRSASRRWKSCPPCGTRPARRIPSSSICAKTMASSKPSSRSPPSAIWNFPKSRSCCSEEVTRLESQNSGLSSKLGAGSSRLGELAAELEQVRNEDRAASGERVALETRHSHAQGIAGKHGRRGRRRPAAAGEVPGPDPDLVGRRLAGAGRRPGGGGEMPGPLPPGPGGPRRDGWPGAPGRIAAGRQRARRSSSPGFRRGRFQAHPPRPFRIRRFPGLAHRPGRPPRRAGCPGGAGPGTIRPVRQPG